MNSFLYYKQHATFFLYIISASGMYLKKTREINARYKHGSAIFYIERIIELLIKIVKSEKLMTLKSNLSIYSIFLFLIIQLAL